MITFEKARIVGNVQLTGLTLTNKLRLATYIDQKIARMLGVEWMLFDSKGIIRNGAHDIGLDNDYNGARFTHEIPKLGKLQLEAVQATKFQVKRLGDGKKKPKKLMLVFQVIYTGAHFELQEHLIKMGKGDGTVTIEAPEQLQLGNAEGGTRVEMSGKPEELPPAEMMYEQKGFTALITVTAVADGFEVTRRAASPTKKLKQGPPAKFASEREAIEEGALDVKRWAEKNAAAEGRGKKRADWNALANWAAELIQPSNLINMPKTDPEVKIIDGDGEVVFEGTAQDLKDAADELRRADVNPAQAAREYPD